MQSRNRLEVHVLVVTIAQQGSFVRAARMLGVGRPSLTRKIAALEQNLGTKLFSRTSRKVELTKAGRVFVMESTISLEHAERAWNLARYQAQIENGPFRIGYSPYMHSSILSLLYRASPPGDPPSSITLKSASTPEMVERVLRGQLHAALGILPIREDDLWIHPVSREGFSLCVPRNHPLAQKANVTIKELDREIVFWMPCSLHPRFYRRVIKYIRSLGVTPTFKEVLAQTHALEFTAQGFGVALLPRSAARISHPGVVFRPLADRYLEIETVLFMRRDLRDGIVKDFIDELASRLQKFNAEK
jgi:LysR family transcriptional regulator, benzoate and cis,cis-muconate-responsive activator of ben and cat genes